MPSPLGSVWWSVSLPSGLNAVLSGSGMPGSVLATQPVDMCMTRTVPWVIQAARRATRRGGTGARRDHCGPRPLRWHQRLAVASTSRRLCSLTTADVSADSGRDGMAEAQVMAGCRAASATTAAPVTSSSARTRQLTVSQPPVEASASSATARMATKPAAPAWVRRGREAWSERKPGPGRLRATRPVRGDESGSLAQEVLQAVPPPQRAEGGAGAGAELIMPSCTRNYSGASTKFIQSVGGVPTADQTGGRRCQEKHSCPASCGSPVFRPCGLSVGGVGGRSAWRCMDPPPSRLLTSVRS